MVEKKFVVTFGQRYRRESHPALGVADPDGWLSVFASDEGAARQEVDGLLGTAWAFLYPWEEFDGLALYPNGEFSFLVEHEHRPVTGGPGTCVGCRVVAGG